MEGYDGDLRLAGAHLLRMHIAIRSPALRARPTGLQLDLTPALHVTPPPLCTQKHRGVALAVKGSRLRSATRINPACRGLWINIKRLGNPARCGKTRIKCDGHQMEVSSSLSLEN
jgi:hypothetical protein